MHDTKKEEQQAPAGLETAVVGLEKPTAFEQLPTSASQDSEPNSLIVNWDGMDDRENPLNWPQFKKVLALGMVTIISLLSPLASTVVAPVTPDILATFESTNGTLGSFVTSIYVLGLTFGPLLIAPLSEIYGRAIMYNVCNFVFFIFNIACALVPNLGGLIAFRLLAGIAASCPLTLGPGSIADMVPIEKRGRAMSGFVMGSLLGPTLGPLIGAFLGQAKGWRWIFWLMSIVIGTVAVLSFFMLRESYPYVILERKTQRLRKEKGNDQLRSKLHTGVKPSTHLLVSIKRPVKMLLSPIVFLLSLYNAVVYGYVFLLFTTFPRIFGLQYGFSGGTVGLVYLGYGVGSFLSLLFTGAVSDRLLQYLKKKNQGASKPEYRLPLMAIGAFFVPLGLFLYAWTAEHRLHWILPIIGTAFLGAGLFMIMMPTLVYLVDAFTIHAASAAAANTVFRSLVGALLPLAGPKMYDSLGVGWGTSVLGFIAVAFIPVPFVFLKFGERIRKMQWSVPGTSSSKRP